METIALTPVEKVEIITLEDNFIDLTSADNNKVVKRGRPAGKTALAGSILAEHGFSALIKITSENKTRTLIMDFGLSDDVAARNAKTLGVDLHEVEAAVLSHGHKDHFGGLERIGSEIGKKGLELIAHPSVFKTGRFVSMGPNIKIPMESADASQIRNAGFKIVTTETPMALMDNQVLFLGQIPRKTAYEKGMPNALCVEGGETCKDMLEDDTAIAVLLEGKGLVVLSGCAHSGIINTVQYAREITGVSRVHAIMGGFHLSGPVFEPIIAETVKDLRKLDPAYIIPTHCTGRRAVGAIEAEMPGAFILNMAGTLLTFAA